MSTKKQSDPFAKLKTAVDHYADLRDERDAALKTAAAALATLEATMDSDTRNPSRYRRCRGQV